jgi:hypothetical protein
MNHPGERPGFVSIICLRDHDDIARGFFHDSSNGLPVKKFPEGAGSFPYDDQFDSLFSRRS